MIRRAAVAGYFYPANKDELTKYLSEVVDYGALYKPKAIIVPHAGYAYSGQIAAKAYSVIQKFDTYVILGPNHTGLGEEISVFDGVYQTPLGNILPNTELIKEIVLNSQAKIDDIAHLKEHSIEVQLPLIQFTNKDKFTIVPIVLGSFDVEQLNDFGAALAKILKDKNALIVVSSDFNHYENKDATIRKDNLAIEKILSLEPFALIETVKKYDISMCGVNAAFVALVTSLKLGAKEGILLEHKTSSEINGDTNHCVGYASIVIQ